MNIEEKLRAVVRLQEMVAPILRQRGDEGLLLETGGLPACLKN
jgi:hypothetical protein